MKIIENTLTEQQKETKRFFIQNGINKTISHILAQRGMKEIEEVNYQYKLTSVFALKGMEEMVKALAQAKKENAKITIVADYDCDGATSCTVALIGLRRLGFNVDFVVPNRFKHGYGLSRAVIDMLIEEKGKPDYIFTVDNGIACQDGVDYANELGIKVLITDHHLPAKDKQTGDIAENPKSVALINPNQKGDTSGLGNMAGCGVAFYTMEATRLYFKKYGLLDKDIHFQDLLDVVALGTIADVVKLDKNNRMLVKIGLDRMKAGWASIGIQSLFNVSQKDIYEANSEDLGFNIGPRINAAGRLEDMTYGIKCLTASNEEEAKNLANKLNDYNVQRKEKEKEMKLYAEEVMLVEDQKDKFTRVIYKYDYHEGVVGIVASRIKEDTGCPVIVFADVEDNEELIKGSGRSVPAIHLRDTLDMIYKEDPSIFVGFGGHSMAAGLTIKKDKLDTFKNIFEKVVAQQITLEELEKTVHFDLALKGEDITLDLAKSLRNIIWGQGFVSPLFKTTGKVLEYNNFGKKEKLEDGTFVENIDHTRMKIDIDGKVFDCVKFYDTTLVQPDSYITFYFKMGIYKDRYSQKDVLSLLIQEYDPNQFDLENIQVKAKDFSDLIRLKTQKA